jgi:hypothetical protein
VPPDAGATTRVTGSGAWGETPGCATGPGGASGPIPERGPPQRVHPVDPAGYSSRHVVQ